MSDDPIRLRDDRRESAALRSALDGLAGADVSYDVDAGFARFVAAAGATAVAATVTTSAAASSGAAASGAASTFTVAGTSLFAKVTLAVTLTSASVFGVWTATRPAAEAPTVVATSHRPVTEVPPALPERSEAERGSAWGGPRERSEREGGQPQATAIATATPVASVPAPVKVRSAIDEETAQLAELRTVADPARSLRAAEAGHARFPKGVFYQEREVIAIRALRSLGRDSEADARAASFVERFPKSPYNESLKR